MKFEIWPFFVICDLWWPLLTSWPLFLKKWRQERHFDIQFTHFPWNSKFDPKWPKIWNLTPNENFFTQKILTSYWSFWAIVREIWCNPRFLIKKTNLNRKSWGKTGIYKSLRYIIEAFNRWRMLFQMSLLSGL